MIIAYLKKNLSENKNNKTLFLDESGNTLLLEGGFVFSDNNYNELLSRDNGFLFVIYNHNQAFFAVDRIRTYPLFYALENHNLFISDDASWIKDKLQDCQIDKKAVIEFYQAGFVSGDQTLCQNIFTLQAGEYVCATRNDVGWIIRKKNYFRYYPVLRSNKHFHGLIEELDEILHTNFKNLKEKYKDRHIVVPLSGGLDSRLIVYWLKRLGCKNVFCYSFGTSSNNDCQKAKEVAERLNYRWMFVDLSRNVWKEAYHSKEYYELKKYYSGYCSLMSTQEFPAFLYMVKNNILPRDCVIFPGHTGDFISGGHVPHNIYEYPLKMQSVVEYIFNKHFALWKTINLSYRKKDFIYIKEKIRSQIGKCKIDTYENMAQIIELYDWQERQAKFIVQFISVYKLFGYAFEMPLWSNRLIDFFLKVPLDLKLNKKLYKCYLKSYDQFGLFQDIESVNNINIKSGGHLLRLRLRKLRTAVYHEWFYKQFIVYFSNSVNYYAPFTYQRLILSFGMYRNPNSFFVQDYLKEFYSGKL